jgi:tetratricopeptide (TPR) repeat protein
MPCEDLLRSAAELHRAGRLAEARDRYLQLLASEPRNAQALNLLGVLVGQMGDWSAARRHIQQAIDVDPLQAGFFANLAEVYYALGQVDDGVATYQQAIARAPRIGELHHALGKLQQRAGLLDDARASYESALRKKPDLVQCRCDLANLLQLRGQGAEAIEHYRQILQARPQHVESLVNLGNALRDLDQPQAALRLLQQAVQLNPDLAAAHNNLGTVLQDLARLNEARACYVRAVELSPTQSEFQLNLASVLRDQGDWSGALATCEEAIRLAPDRAQAEYRRGTLLLALGRFAEGWAAYEARAQCPQFRIPAFAQPRWRGEALAGKTLLVHAEQGLGDTLQFIRYVKRIEPFGGRVIVAVQRPLLSLLAASGFDGLVANDDPLPAFDLYVPLLSLPGIFGTDATNIPRNVPYLAAEPARVEQWADKMPGSRGPRVGIVWQGRPTYRGDRLRSIPLTCFKPLAAGGATLISLQKGAGADQLADLAGRFEVIDLGQALDDDGAFVDTAALMKNLDLVISSDTAAAHLAGGLGVPVWVALALAPEWRWLATGDQSPWYPTMRLFRQSRVGQWSDVFERMADELSSIALRGPN